MGDRNRGASAPGRARHFITPAGPNVQLPLNQHSLDRPAMRDYGMSPNAHPIFDTPGGTLHGVVTARRREKGRTSHTRKCQ